MLSDRDFQYLMKHENKATLQLNAVNMFGVSLLSFSERAERLREIEAQKRESVIAAGKSGKDGGSEQSAEESETQAEQESTI